MRVDPKKLVGRLDKRCLAALEAGVSFAVARGHYEVSVEHVVRALLDDADGDVAEIFRHYEVHPSRVIAAAERALEGMTTGNTGKPVFSPLLFSWLEDAHLLSTVELGLPKVRSGALLLALLLRPGRTGITEHTEELTKIPPPDLRARLLDLMAESAEQEEAQQTQQTQGAQQARPGAARARAAGEEALARYTHDLSAKAEAGGIDPVLARDREIRQMIDVLTRRRKNNPILIGEAGVGKTAVVEGFVRRVAAGDVPDALKGVRVLNLDLGLLQAGAGMRGEFENRLKQVIHEVKSALVPTIVFIDEAHTLIGAGGGPGGGDAANLLKPALARGELRTIGATTFGEYKKYIEKDPALERRFQPITVAEPSVEDTVVMLRGIKPKFEAHHGVEVLDEALEAAAKLGARYITGRLLPDKAVDLLDTACARVAVGQTSKPAALDQEERELEHLRDAVKSLTMDVERVGADHGERLGALRAEEARREKARARLHKRWTRQRELFDKIRELRGALEGAEVARRGSLERQLRAASAKLRKLRGEQALVHLYVDAEVIAAIVSDWTGVPVGAMLRDELRELAALEERLGERIVGQDAALSTIAERIRAHKSGLTEPSQPIGVFLLVGPSGVGKTETGLALAERLFGGERFVVTVNMSEFMEKHTVSRLIGSPPGYVGFGEGGVLTEAVRHRPYSVVLLDEVEKAHPEVMNLFHQVFDKGMLADGEGRVIDFKNTVIVMTSNLGTQEIEAACEAAEEKAEGGEPASPGAFAETLTEAVRPALLRAFKPALLGRMTVVPYLPLPEAVLTTILKMKLRRIAERLRARHGLHLKVTAAAQQALLARCQDRESGARNIDHVLNASVLPKISEQILLRMAEGEDLGSLTLGAQGQALRFRFDAPKAAPEGAQG